MKFLIVLLMVLVVGCAAKRGCKLECDNCGKVELECSGGMAGNGSLPI